MQKLSYFIVFMSLLGCSTTQKAKRLPAQTFNCHDAFRSLNNPLEQLYRPVAIRKSTTAYPNIPSIEELHLANEAPAALHPSLKPSPGLIDREIEEARVIGGVFEDYKPLSDAKPRQLSTQEELDIIDEAKRLADDSGFEPGTPEHRRVYLKHSIEKRFRFDKDLISIDPHLYPKKWSINITDSELHPNTEAAFDYVEQTWQTLIKRTPTDPNGSVLPLPYEFVVANATRFDEMYYWDTYFGMQGLIATGRLDLSQKIVDNFLHMIQKYGIIPNGNRDYYLTRSQPPFISSMVKEVYEATLKQTDNVEHAKTWLRERAYPLIKSDFENFWMDPHGRFDAETGLHHHWDDVNLARPERHSADKELAESLTDEHGLGLTYRDTRAVAESGLDFTDGLGKEASSTANILLNSMIYKYARDLESMALELGLNEDATRFARMAEAKKEAINRYLWDEASGQYRNYSIKHHKQLEGVHAEMFTALYSGVASPEQARALRGQLSRLEKDGGVMSSLFTDSHHQWDGDNGWAPLHYFIIRGMRDYGYDDDAKRIAHKITNTYSKIHAEEGVFLERVDVATMARPIEDGKKYPVQEGFLWTNGVYTWALTDVLGQRLTPLAP